MTASEKTCDHLIPWGQPCSACDKPKECPLNQRACKPAHCAWGYRDGCVTQALVRALQNLERGD